MSVENFQKNIALLGISDIEVLETDEKTHSAAEAAAVHGVPVSNIVKSLLVAFRPNSDDPFQYALVLVPGDKRLDLDLWKIKLAASELRMSNADEVKLNTGFSIGGVPPFGHDSPLQTYIEEGFDQEIELVAAAGSANSVFKIKYSRLKELVNG